MIDDPATAVAARSHRRAVRAGSVSRRTDAVPHARAALLDGGGAARPGAPGTASDGYDRDRAHLDEKVGMGEALDDGGRDDRRIGSVTPHSLERCVAGSEI